jgi:hypothetical protein
MIIPGKIEIDFKHYKEVAQEITLDRAEIINPSDILDTPAGEFSAVLNTEEADLLNLKKKMCLGSG